MFVDDSIWCGQDAASIQEILRRSELFCEFHQVRVNRDKRVYISLNDSGTQDLVRWTPNSACPLWNVLNRKGRHGGTKRTRGEPDGRVIKYLGVYFEAVAGWKNQQQVLKEKHSKLTTDLRHVAINEWEAVYLINAKIIPTIRYPLQVAVMPLSVLTANSRVHGTDIFLTFDTRGRFSLDSMGISARGAMSMIRVHSGCWDKSLTCLLSTRPSSTR